ncbi:MAG: hypothetical protein IKP69_00090 [Oscillospiraceae bacterium]|nr:hypothetical protein [Oscillospiraceae bacterium]
MLKFLVKQQKIEILEREVIASDQISFVTLRFTFDGDWKKFYKVVQFTQCDETFNRVLGFDGLSCLLPAELHAGAVKMSVFGYDTNNTSGLRATTVPITLNIRQSGFVGDDSPIPPTPDLYTQILQKIEEVTAPDMSQYPKKDEIQSMIENALKNSEAVIPSDYVTIQKMNDEILMIHESITPIRENSHTHQNKELLDSLTADSLALLPDLQQFEDVTKYEIQTIKESLDPAVRQAHFHENLDILDGITSAKISEWDSMKSNINNFMNNMTVFSEKLGNTTSRVGTTESEITALQKTMETLQKQIESLDSSNFVTLFSNENHAQYAPEIGLILNGGYHLMNDFINLYPNFCTSANAYALSYSQTDFGWDSEILTVCTKELNLSAKSEIIISFKSGAAEDGKLYLVEKPQYIDVPITIYVKDRIDRNQAVDLNFKWLQSENYVSVMTECEKLASGKYYLAWAGRSNNTHPLIKNVKVLE